MRLAVYTMGHTALGEEKERRVIIIHPPQVVAAANGKWRETRGTKCLSPLFWAPSSHCTVSEVHTRREGGREGGRERGAGISPPKDQFLSPSPPLPDLGNNICNISQKHRLYVYFKVASILLKPSRGGWEGGQCSHIFPVICASRKYGLAQQGSSLSQNSNPVWNLYLTSLRNRTNHSLKYGNMKCLYTLYVSLSSISCHPHPCIHAACQAGFHLQASVPVWQVYAGGFFHPHQS